MKGPRIKKPPKPVARIHRQTWVVMYAPSTFVCERCGADEDIGAEAPLLEPDRGALFNNRAGAFILAHRGCRGAADRG